LSHLPFDIRGQSKGYNINLSGSAYDARQNAWRELFIIQKSDKDLYAIKKSLDYNYPLWNERFKDQPNPQSLITP